MDQQGLNARYVRVVAGASLVVTASGGGGGRDPSTKFGELLEACLWLGLKEAF